MVSTIKINFGGPIVTKMVICFCAIKNYSFYSGNVWKFMSRPRNLQHLHDAIVSNLSLSFTAIKKAGNLGFLT